ncbi:hypothetical protein H9P43_000567 [Blastocladiella emersonii ATCC 22665]|nr:hypothetical protein H9P43_000567 [Blastocladiella emersonii ATCC 22665]
MPSTREAIDPHLRYLYRLLSPAIPLVSENRAADALLDRKHSLPRYMGVHTPGSAVQISGFAPSSLADAVALLAEAGYVDAEGGVSWNCAWPVRARRRTDALDAVSSSLLHDVTRLLDGVHAIRDAIADDAVPVSLVLPVSCSLSPDRPAAAVADEFQPVAEALLESTGPAVDRLVLDPAGCTPAAVSEIKRRWPALTVDLDLSTRASVSMETLAGYRDGGLLDGVVLGRSVAADPTFLLQLEDTQHDAGFLDNVVRNYAVYADVCQHLYGYPYRAQELLAPLFHVYGGHEGRYFRTALQDTLKAYTSNRLYLAPRASPLTATIGDAGDDDAEYAPGPVFGIIDTALELLQHERTVRGYRGRFSAPFPRRPVVGAGC